jgi:hypothetical protein
MHNIKEIFYLKGNHGKSWGNQGHGHHGNHGQWGESNNSILNNILILINIKKKFN